MQTRLFAPAQTRSLTGTWTRNTSTFQLSLRMVESRASSDSVSARLVVTSSLKTGSYGVPDQRLVCFLITHELASNSQGRIEVLSWVVFWQRGR